MKIKQSIIALAFAAIALPLTAFANSGAALKPANIDIHNKQSLQRGAKYFVNYCQGCHSLKFSRYNRIATDLGLTDEQVKNNLIFTRDKKGDPTKVGSLMENALDREAAAAWFGAPPPDLSLVGRSRGPDWIYTYLNSFYADPSRPMGVNNTVFPNVGMPHVLVGLQGVQKLEATEHGEHEGEGAHHEAPKLVMEKAGSMGQAEYQMLTRDITNFLTYVAEPASLHRKTYGVWVMLFLGIFFIFAYLLKKEYWKDVH